ncbi:helix-turn-helix domain-containing protein [Burkholderia sp. BCC0322]|uniref:helix-turn-helix domain-containing protein n=1 Tax=unclassified Burkholderia TaxID=2613784 RepID=UPI00158E972E|nr:helix-turn-helix transcriptional regulator [Burkholderia sp. BCC0322]
MDISEIRRRNYEFLFERFKEAVRAESGGPEEAPEHGMLKRFAEKIGVSQAYMSHINTGYKPIGARMARKFEHGLSLPDGWMDHVHDETSTRSPEEEAFIAAALELYRESPTDAQAALLKAFAAKLRTGAK